MPEIFNVIQSEGIDLINNTRANLGSTGQNATNKTSHSLRVDIRQEVTKIKLQLLGRPFFTTVQTGRKPTPGKKPSREMIDNIKDWINARGMDESAAWAIATKINQEGTKLWKQGGRTDVYSPAIDEFVNNVSTEVLDTAADNIIIKVRDMEW